MLMFLLLASQQLWCPFCYWYLTATGDIDVVGGIPDADGSVSLMSLLMLVSLLLQASLLLLVN
jgi:hypothetical protein